MYKRSGPVNKECGDCLEPAFASLRGRRRYPQRQNSNSRRLDWNLEAAPRDARAGPVSEGDFIEKRILDHAFSAQVRGRREKEKK
jgi:hypothetical protein